MPKEVKVYEADDKKVFKTRSGAENHNKKLAVADAIERLNMTEKEIGEKLENVSGYLPLVKVLLKNQSNWTKWSPHHIKMINTELFKQPIKTTKYIREYKCWGETKEEELFVEKGVDFTDPELYCKDEYKVIKVEDVSSIVKKIYYDYKYEWDVRMAMKLKDGSMLSESEINNLKDNFDEIYREEGRDRRWSRAILSVIDVNDELYAIEWDQGLTENQEDTFYNQPYPVTLETEEVVVTKTKVVKK